MAPNNVHETTHMAPNNVHETTHMAPSRDSDQVSVSQSLLSEMRPSDLASHRSPVSQISHDDRSYDKTLNATEKQHTVKSKRQHRIAVWWPEAIAMAVSIALMITIAAVLLAFDKKPLDSWKLPWHIQPNALVSVLMTLCKFTMLIVVGECLGQLKWVYFEQQPHPLSHFQIFDDASRGPWGSFLLLFRVHITPVMASLGALIMILALAMEPFTQQVLSYSSENKTETSAAIQMSRVFDYGGNLTTVNKDTPSTPNPFAKLSTSAMSGAILASLTNTSASISATCTTGNCTWPTFDSLGICSTCRDVSHELVKECVSRDMPAGPIDPGYEAWCTYTTPLGANLSVHFSMEMHSVSADGGIYTLWNSTMPSTGAMSDPHAVTDLPTLANLSSIWMPSDWFEASGCTNIGMINCTVPQPRAWDCSLSWCAKTYESDIVTDGTLHDAPSKETSLELPFEPSRDYPDNGSHQAYDACLGIVDTIPATGYGFIYPPLRLAAFPEGTPLPSEECPAFNESSRYPDAYWINYGDSQQLNIALKSLFTQSLANDDSTSLGQVLYSANSGNFPKTMENIAIGLTNAIRQAPNSSVAQGETISQVVLIRVNWQWLVYPAALVLMTFLFMIATFFFASENSQAVWKTSSLAVLFHGPAGWGPEEVDERSLKGMEMSAKSMTASLAQDGDGVLKLVRR